MERGETTAVSWRQVVHLLRARHTRRIHAPLEFGLTRINMYATHRDVICALLTYLRTQHPNPPSLQWHLCERCASQPWTRPHSHSGRSDAARARAPRHFKIRRDTRRPQSRDEWARPRTLSSLALRLSGRASPSTCTRKIAAQTTRLTSGWQKHNHQTSLCVLVRRIGAACALIHNECRY